MYKILYMNTTSILPFKKHIVFGPFTHEKTGFDPNKYVCSLAPHLGSALFEVSTTNYGNILYYWAYTTSRNIILCVPRRLRVLCEASIMASYSVLKHQRDT